MATNFEHAFLKNRGIFKKKVILNVTIKQIAENYIVVDEQFMQNFIVL